MRQTEYEKHVAERAAMGVVPKPISAAQCAELVKLLENPPSGEEEYLLDLLTHRVPPGVDEAAYVKADFLTAIVKGKTKSPLIDTVHAVKLLGTMQGGYNVTTLIDALDTDALAPTAVAVSFSPPHHAGDLHSTCDHGRCRRPPICWCSGRCADVAAAAPCPCLQASALGARWMGHEDWHACLRCMPGRHRSAGDL